MSDNLVINAAFVFPDDIFPAVSNPFPGLPAAPGEKIAKIQTEYVQHVQSFNGKFDRGSNAVHGLFKWAREVMDFAEYQPGLPSNIIDTAKDIIEMVTTSNSRFAGPANYILGLWYMFGLFGKEPDPMKSFDYFLHSAKVGYSRALYRLGSSYEAKGDIKTALIYFECGLKCGDAACYYRMAMAYLRGHLGKPKDPTLGLRYLENSSLLSDPDCPQSAYIYGLVQLGELSDIKPWGEDEATQAETGIRAMERSAWLGFGPALVRMGKAWQGGEKGFDATVALRYFHLASRQEQYARYKDSVSKGNYSSFASSSGELGGVPEIEISKWLLCGSEGVLEPNEEWAFKFASLGAEQCNGTAEFAVGYFYEVGIFVSSSLGHALEWYKISASHACAEAENRLRELEGIQGLQRQLTRKDHERTISIRGKGSIRARRKQVQTQDQLGRELDSKIVEDEELVEEPTALQKKRRPKSLLLADQLPLNSTLLPPKTPLPLTADSKRDSLPPSDEGLEVIKEDSDSIVVSPRCRHKHSNSLYSNLSGQNQRLSPLPRRTSSPVKSTYTPLGATPSIPITVLEYGSQGISSSPRSRSPSKESTTLEHRISDLNIKSVPTSALCVNQSQQRSPKQIARQVLSIMKSSARKVSGQRKVSMVEAESEPVKPVKAATLPVESCQQTSQPNSGTATPTHHSFYHNNSSQRSSVRSLGSSIGSRRSVIEQTNSDDEDDDLPADHRRFDVNHDDDVPSDDHLYRVAPLQVQSSQASMQSQISSQSFVSGSESLNVRQDDRLKELTLGEFDFEARKSSSKASFDSHTMFDSGVESPGRLESPQSLESRESPYSRRDSEQSISSLLLRPSRSDLRHSPTSPAFSGSSIRSASGGSGLSKSPAGSTGPFVTPSRAASHAKSTVITDGVGGPSRKSIQSPATTSLSSFSRTSTTSSANSANSISTSTTASTWNSVTTGETNDRLSELKKHQPTKGSPLKHSNSQRHSGVAMTFEEMGIPKGQEEEGDCIVM